MQKAIITTLTILILTASITTVSAEVILGPIVGDGNVTLTNPDGSYFFFDSTNSSSYQYIHNLPDGWWSLQIPADDGYWVIGLLFGLGAFAVAIIALVKRKTNNDED